MDNFDMRKWRRSFLFEGEMSSAPYTKKIGNLTWEDVAGLSLPTGESGGVMNTMDDRDMFSPERKESMLNNWKARISRSFPNALNMDITIDRNNPTWFERAVITDPEYIETMKKKEDAFQAEYDRYRGSYQGD